jgi:hypothetical protein
MKGPQAQYVKARILGGHPCTGVDFTFSAVIQQCSLTARAQTLRRERVLNSVKCHAGYQESPQFPSQ